MHSTLPTFTEHLLRTKNCSRRWGATRSEADKTFTLTELEISRERPVVNNKRKCQRVTSARKNLQEGDVTREVS